MFNTIDIVLSMGFAWIIYGICLLVISRRRLSVSAWSGSFLLIVFSLTLLDNFLKPGMLPEGITMFLFAFSRNSYFLIGPSLWLYTRSVLSEKKISFQDILHLLPFLIIVLTTGFSPTMLIPADAPSSDHVNGFLMNSPEFLRNLLSILSRGIYCFIVFRLIRRHGKSVVDYYSRRTLLNTLLWLYYLVIFYLFLFLLNFIILLIPPMKVTTFQSLIVTIVRVGPSLLFIFLFSLFAQNQPIPENKKIQKTIPSGDNLKQGKSAKNDKNKTSGMALEESRRIYEQINTSITENKLFLNSDLTLSTLAEKTGDSRHHISEAINREAGENFYGYINGFRLREFISCLNENRYPHLTITAIAFECGFKSNSAFYSLFKKKMGMTPKDYMKNESR